MKERSGRNSDCHQLDVNSESERMGSTFQHCCPRESPSFSNAMLDRILNRPNYVITPGLQPRFRPQRRTPPRYVFTVLFSVKDGVPKSCLFLMGRHLPVCTLCPASCNSFDFLPLGFANSLLSWICCKLSVIMGLIARESCDEGLGPASHV